MSKVFRYILILRMTQVSGCTDNRKIRTIKLVKDSIGLGLKDAKAFVEQHEHTTIKVSLDADQTAKLLQMYHYGDYHPDSLVPVSLQIVSVESIEAGPGSIIDLTGRRYDPIAPR